MADDRIVLEGMVFYGYHGVNQAEKESGQRFIVDLEVEKDLTGPGKSDDVKDTVSYSDLFRVVKDVMEGPSRDLLESLAAEIAERVLEGFDVEAMKVAIKKPEVPIKGSVLSHAAVEITRRRQS